MNGEQLYTIYGGVTDFKNFQGNPMPAWKDLPEKIQLAWNTVSEYAETNQMEEIALEPRELWQVHHAIDYVDNHSPAGVPGHGQFVLIAKLARALGYEYDK